MPCPVAGRGQVGEAQGRVIVVEFQRRDPRGVGLKAENQDVAHQPHVLADVLRNAVGRAVHVRLVECRSPALQFAPLAGVFDPLLDVAHRVEIFVELPLVAGADLAAEPLGIRQHRVQHALVAGRHLILEQAIEGQGRIKLQRRRRRRRAPRNVRAVEHRVILVDRRVRSFAAQNEARHLGRAAVAFGPALDRSWCRSEFRRRKRSAPRRADCRFASYGCSLCGPRREIGRG